MARFNKPAPIKPVPKPPIYAPPVSTGQRAFTHEGAVGWAKTLHQELFTLAATNMGSDSFYESAVNRDSRFVNLIHRMTREDPEWLAAFVPFLRDKMFMRSASVMAAAEYLHASLAMGDAFKGPRPRRVVASAISRMDEPGEMIGYWTARYGRQLPMALKRGVADAIEHKLNQYNGIKYDTGAWTLGDVIEVVHPRAHHSTIAGVALYRGVKVSDVYEAVDAGIRKRWVWDEEGYRGYARAIVYESNPHVIGPGDVDLAAKAMGMTKKGLIDALEREKEAKGALYRYLLDTRHHAAGEITVEPHLLPMIAARRALYDIPVSKRRGVLLSSPGRIPAAGMTWESLAAWLNGPMDAKAWEAVIPAMGYMALLRNLRNFDAAGISESTRGFVIGKLTDPDEVARSKQFPFRFWTAYKNLATLEWSSALEKALNLSTSNIPELPGSTLILVDVSASMSSPFRSEKERREGGGGWYYGVRAQDEDKKPRLFEIAALFGVAVLRKTERAKIVAFGTNSAVLPIPAHGSVLKGIETVGAAEAKYGLGHGTNAYQALERHYKGEDRVIIFTDGQVFPGNSGAIQNIPLLVVDDLQGYGPAGFAGRNVLQIGGYSDQMFTMLGMIEMGKRAEWPWMIGREVAGVNAEEEGEEEA